MDTNLLDSYCDSDEEIFFGRMTMKEVKRAAFLGRVTAGKSSFYDIKNDEDDNSFKLIETKSEPNLLIEHSSVSSIRCSPDDKSLKVLNDDDVHLDELDDDLYDRFSSARSDWIYHVSDKSFEDLERLVGYKVPECSDINAEGMENENATDFNTKALEGLTHSESQYDPNNTFERMEHILKYGEKIVNTPCNSDVKLKTPSKDVVNTEPNIKINYPLKTTLENKKMKFFGTPTPSKILNIGNSQMKKSERKSPFFKIPVKSRMPKPVFGLPTQTPLQNNFNSASSASFQEIVSPIGFYIKHSPLVPKIKNIRPGKELPAFNISEVVEQSDHKENIVLPAKAYTPAKTTRLVDETTPSGLPKNNQVKKMVDKLGMPQVIRHQRREMLNVSKLPLSSSSKSNTSGYQSVHSRSEDSFADLSMVNGDVSVCVKKQAFRMTHGNKR